LKAKIYLYINIFLQSTFACPCPLGCGPKGALFLNLNKGQKQEFKLKLQVRQSCNVSTLAFAKEKV
jgi:hypothetical protein